MDYLCINPDTDLKHVLFAGTHPVAVMSIKSGKVDAGAFAVATINRLSVLHKMSPGDVRVLWTPDLIPNSCTAVRKGLPERLKKEIQAAFIAIPTEDPELWRSWTRAYQQGSASGTVNVAVNDATYNGLRKYAAQVKDFNSSEN